jgi:hypothetical protein
MALNINDDAITGEHTSHTAHPAPGHPGAWQVSWLPGRLLDRNAAITAMILADIATSTDTLHDGHQRWPHIQGWAAELGLTAPDALTRITEGVASAGRQDPEPEAAG